MTLEPSLVNRHNETASLLNRHGASLLARSLEQLRKEVTALLRFLLYRGTMLIANTARMTEGPRLISERGAELAIHKSHALSAVYLRLLRLDNNIPTHWPYVRISSCPSRSFSTYSAIYL